jgi:beta-glucosidase
VARTQVEAYVEGMQNGKTGLTPDSVVTVVKHWVGYGAQKDGWDSHNYYGRFSAVSNAELAYHIKPFLGAFDAHVAAIMPTYSILENVSINGQPLERVGAGFSKPLLTDLLRDTYGFKGVVVSDWVSRTTAASLAGMEHPPDKSLELTRSQCPGVLWRSLDRIALPRLSTPV